MLHIALEKIRSKLYIMNVAIINDLLDFPEYLPRAGEFPVAVTSDKIANDLRSDRYIYGRVEEARRSSLDYFTKQANRFSSDNYRILRASGRKSRERERERMREEKWQMRERLAAEPRPCQGRTHVEEEPFSGLALISFA